MHDALLLACLLLPQSTPDDAEELLHRAEQLADQLHFGAADALYRQILKSTESGPIADRARAHLAPSGLLVTRELEHNGRPDNRVDVFVMAEGYQRRDQEQKTFATQAELTQRLFFQVDVFARYRKYFNFYAMHLASKDDGVDREGKEYDTALGAYQTKFSQGQVAVRSEDVERYLGSDQRSDGLAIVIVRKGTLGTGGGGIAVVGGGAGNTVVHEWGHAFGQLLDEYTSDVGYGDAKVSGYNISDTEDPARVPWRHWLAAKTNGVGLFPGGAGRAKGEWRPTGGPCAMSSGPTYCLVCREAIVANLYGIVSPIDEATEVSKAIVVKPGAPAVVEIVPMEPQGGPQLEVQFGLLAASESATLPRAAPRRDHDESLRPRWGKEADAAPAGTALAAKKVRRDDRRIAHQLTLETPAIAPGDYVLEGRVRDPTPWVLKPEWQALLSASRRWHVTVTAGP
ncbi:MAG: M64 family metallopeptidase [Planctomycetota bacterium]